MAWTKEKMRHTGELITAAIWNTEVVNNTILVGESGPELIRPFLFQGAEVVECQFCGQLNQVDMDKLYKGCGACGAPFDTAQFAHRLYGKREREDLSMLSTSVVIDPYNTYWFVGTAAELGKTTTLGF